MQVLSLLRVLDREQAARVSGFKSTTRINTRLLKLTRAGLLKRFFFVSALGGKKAVYCLSRKGADFIGVAPSAISRPADSFLLGDKFVAHQLATNQVYCAARLGRGAQYYASVHWRVFSQPISDAVPIIPDAYFEIQANEMIRPMFLEVDLGTESLAVWTKKTNEYLNLAASGEFERVFGQPRFGVAVACLTERRMQSLRAQVRKLTSKLFYFSTMGKINTLGFWSEAWLRPEGEQTQSLT